MILKKLNKYGHGRGDKVLEYVSKIILENVGNRDFIGRIGGDEFVMIVHKRTVKEVKRIVERIRREVEECSVKDVSEKNKTSCTVSASIDEIRNDDILESVLERAEKRLYKAKFLGKNRVIA